jgi:hypothetical protein
MAGDVRKSGLDITPDDIPRYHAAIVGWPDEKEKQIAFAQELAALSILVIR